MRIKLALWTVIAISVASIVAKSAGSGPGVSRGPGDAGPWLAWPSAESAGFDRTALNAAHHKADEMQSGSVMVVYRGKVLAAWGDVAREFQAHSVRKSLVSAVIGILAAQGAVDLDASLGELGIDDDGKLTALERSATVRNLIAARSGIYLPAAYAPQDQDVRRPERGSHQPGTHWFYNNWDFNVAGVIAERATREKDLYAAFDRLIAEVIGMEDFSVDDGLRVFEPSASVHPALTFRISSRDLARLGQLYLQEGIWAGERVVPADWVRASTAAVSDFGDNSGYGYMWWTYEPGSVPEYPLLNAFRGFAARGTGGQALIVLPEAGIVFVHRGDTDHGRLIGWHQVVGLLESILQARVAEPEPDPAFGPVSVLPFETQLPPPPPQTFIELSPEEWAAYYGRYAIAEGAVARVFSWQGRPFMSFPGRGEGELFALGNDRFTIQVVAGVDVRFERDASGAVVGVSIEMAGQQIDAPKIVD